MRRTLAIITIPVLLIVALCLFAMNRTEPEEAVAPRGSDSVPRPPVVETHHKSREKSRETLEEIFARILAEERAARSASASGAQALPTARTASAETPATSIETTSAGSTRSGDTPSDATRTEPLWAMHVYVAHHPDDLIDIESIQLIGRLIITGSQFSNRSLQSLQGQRILSLSIEAPNIGDAGLLHVRQVKHLRELRLWTPSVTDQGLKIIAQMSDLEVLDLEGTNVQAAGLAQLEDLEKLYQLTLGPKTQNQDLAVLTTFPRLEELDLRSCHQLTDECLASLARLSHLQTIWLPAKLAAVGEEALRKALPDCQVRS